MENCTKILSVGVYCFAMEDDDYEPGYLDDYPDDKIDDKVIDAEDAILNLFNRDPSRIYYIRQLQLKFEERFFHWITGKAISELVKSGDLSSVRRPLSSEFNTNLGRRAEANFVFKKTNRYYKRTINRYLEVINSYSDPNLTNAYGKYAEQLFLLALLKRGFQFVNEDTNEFNGKKWNKTNHNLDFIIKKDNISYGCEVKNKLNYIDRNELDIKLEMCAYLGLVPLFIMRYSPKSYNNEIINNVGYLMIFETQIFPLDKEDLVRTISGELELPVVCSGAIPDSIIDRFMGWHNKRMLRILK